jgi:glutamate-5-semialdehyde dehydrogenase
VAAVSEKAKEAYDASTKLANAGVKEKDAALVAMAEAIEKNRKKILAANAKDVAAGGRLSKALLDRLKLSDAKIDGIVKSIQSVKKLDDPVGKTLAKTELDKGLILSKVSVPIGVIGAVFESRPDVVPQIASLCLKTGNSVVFKGGSEAAESNKFLYEVIREATEGAGIPKGWIQMIETRKDVSELLKLDDYVSLLVPRGSNKFVKHIMENTSIPVLGHADGICHIFVDRDADLKMAEEVCFDAKTQYPAVCNAMETMLVDEKIAEKFLPAMCEHFAAAGVELRGDGKTGAIVNCIKKATEEDWRTEYNDLILSIKVVADADEAINHINEYGSHHTDSIITKNKATAKKFLAGVDSACVFHNCSTRFSDGFRFGLGAEVGISTGKTHARGPVGLEGLVIYKWVLEGSGQTVREYAEGKKKFTHKKIK